MTKPSLFVQYLPEDEEEVHEYLPDGGQKPEPKGRSEALPGIRTIFFEDGSGSRDAVIDQEEWDRIEYPDTPMLGFMVINYDGTDCHGPFDTDKGAMIFQRRYLTDRYEIGRAFTAPDDVLPGFMPGVTLSALLLTLRERVDEGPDYPQDMYYKIPHPSLALQALQRWSKEYLTPYVVYDREDYSEIFSQPQDLVDQLLDISLSLDDVRNILQQGLPPDSEEIDWPEEATEKDKQVVRDMLENQQ